MEKKVTNLEEKLSDSSRLTQYENLKQKYTNLIYEEWGIAMIKKSRLGEDALAAKIIGRFKELESLNYTRVATVAAKQGYTHVSDEIIALETQLVKKIPFLLEMGNKYEAL